MKLNKTQQKQFEALWNTFEKAVDKLVQAVQTKDADLQVAVDAYNSARVALYSFSGAIADDIEAYVDERSEAWHESDKAEAYEEWQGQWKDFAEELEQGLSIKDGELSDDILIPDDLAQPEMEPGV